MKNRKSGTGGNPLWKFLSSVRLAIFLLIILAVTSIVGTIIPQGETMQFYLNNYGPGMFKAIKLLRLDDTYHSWWYLTLLGLFSLNLIVCTLNRLPFTLKLFKRDYIDVTADYLQRASLRHKWTLKAPVNSEKITKIVDVFREKAGNIREKRLDDGGTVYMAESGKWSYWGLYGLHLSILIIFAGAVYGSMAGFKGRIMLLEGETTDHAVASSDVTQKIPLGFLLRCDRFVVDFYDTGAPKLFRSDLAVIEDGKEVLKKSIEVNDPLTYKGITFYQSSYQSIPEVNLRITDASGGQRNLVIPAFQRVSWPEAGLTLGLMKFLPNVHGVPAARIWIGESTGRADAIWLFKGSSKTINAGGKTYRVELQDAVEKYMTGLQVKKDPGVWVVWLGCTGLIIGFAIVFWVAHRRMWLYVGPGEKETTTVILAGLSNKNKMKFENEFEEIKTALDAVTGEGK